MGRLLQRGAWAPRQYILEWLAKHIGASLPAMVLTWMVTHGRYPIVSSTSPDHVAANWAAAHLTLDDSTVTVMDHRPRRDDLVWLAAWDGGPTRR